ncbi:hypothetical protein [Paractinoplanes lichenicola]|uniref:Uncharacterized protein n=1 Tax=Paractinoplanes lichenicola TaxID=2802976 RepID=A0ABS1VQD9_9ACTN|nr:hypothetical protein [Actinoplanes lichenicola]MBL7255751.1 hypothetical protein [Actinoplanes lichenicola]
MIEAPVSLAELPRRVWTEDEWRRIARGYTARDMDEKWDVAVEGAVAHLHRSWTGNRIFEVTFEPVAGGRRISAVTVESDPSRYRRSGDRYDCVLIEVVISYLLLGEDAAELRAELAGAAERPELILHRDIGLRGEPRDGLAGDRQESSQIEE